MKKNLKIKAVNLRQLGLSYSEILKQIKVSRSTLSLWLRSVGLAKQQKQRLTDKRRMAALKGATRRKVDREVLEIKLKNKAIKQIKKISINELFLIGIALYWAEGSKISKRNISGQVIFCNSDPKMIEIFLKWLKLCLKIPLSKIEFSLYIHESVINKKDIIINYWSNSLKIKANLFDKVYLKKNKISNNRDIEKYFGILRVRIKKSTNLNREIVGLIEGIYIKQCGIV